jgi:sigma-54 dependent transcriptional regulator, acetoin dehydrogenase operon transcriptional activator AcoR
MTNQTAHGASPRRTRAAAALRKRAWVEFVAGDDALARRELSTEILRSWYRCRDLYRLDPVGPGRVATQRPPVGWARRWDDAYTQLGGSAAALAHGGSGCLSTVTDADGRILALWAGGGMGRRAAEQGLDGDTRWSEPAGGTSGVGTATVAHRAILVRGPEHWRRDLHAWTCLAAPVFDPVTAEPVATLSVASLSEVAVTGVARSLASEVAATQERLDRRAAHDAHVVAEHFAAQERRRSTKLLGIDWAGNVIAASLDVRALLRTAEPGFTREACGSRGRTCTLLREIAANALPSALADASWRGTAVLGPPVSARPELYSVAPVFSADRLVGWTLAGLDETADPGTIASEIQAPGPPGAPDRIAALVDNAVLLLDTNEIRYAEANRHAVWLVTDCGRVRAATRGMDNLERELSGRGFIRVHRGFLVNPARVRRVVHKGNGLICLDTEGHRTECIPVSRRCTRRVQQALGL